MKAVNIKLLIKSDETDEFFYLKAISNDWGIIEYTLVDQFDIKIKSYNMIILRLPQLLKNYKEMNQLLSDIKICFTVKTDVKTVYALKR